MTIPARSSIVSVVIPTYNHAPVVAGAVESALRQTCRPIEVVVVDDGSTDATREVLEPYASSIQYLYQPNRGAGAARNLGIQRSTGELLAFLDADDRWLPDKLAAQVACLAARPEAALVHTAVSLWDPEGIAGESPACLHYREFDGHCYARLSRGGGLRMSSVMVRRRALERVGLFDATIRGASAEDYDLWCRLARWFEFAYVDVPLTLYRVRPAHETRTAARLQDELRVVRRHLRDDPGLRALLGSRHVRARLFRIACDLGYLQLEAGAWRDARRAFAAALRQQPAHLALWGLWGSLLLSPRVTARLRRAKRSLERGSGAA